MWHLEEMSERKLFRSESYTIVKVKVQGQGSRSRFKVKVQGQGQGQGQGPFIRHILNYTEYNQ